MVCLSNQDMECSNLKDILNNLDMDNQCLSQDMDNQCLSQDMVCLNNLKDILNNQGMDNQCQELDNQCLELDNLCQVLGNLCQVWVSHNHTDNHSHMVSLSNLAVS